jgi:hypothetical protein
MDRMASFNAVEPSVFLLLLISQFIFLFVMGSLFVPEGVMVADNVLVSPGINDISLLSKVTFTGWDTVTVQDADDVVITPFVLSSTVTVIMASPGVEPAIMFPIRPSPLLSAIKLAIPGLLLDQVTVLFVMFSLFVPEGKIDADNGF